MDEQDARRRFGEASRVVLATTGPRGPDLVPITFALDGDRIVTLVDHKPKTTTALRRLRNVEADPVVTVLADRWDDDDWSRLWWVRVRGRARVVAGGAERQAAAALVAARYDAYRGRPPAGPAIVIETTEWRWWSAT